MGTVLILDDDADLRETVSGMLAEVGYSVCAADGIESALARLASAPIDLIFMDYAIPSPAHGEAFLRTKAADDRIASIPVVLMSGYAVDPHLDGTVAVLRKPFDAESLIATVGRIIGPPDSQQNDSGG
jgi:CheY-like chemotaxis protein